MAAVAAQHFQGAHCSSAEDRLQQPLPCLLLCPSWCQQLRDPSSITYLALFPCRSEDSGVSALVADEDLSGVVADLPEDSLDVSIDDLMGSMAVSPPTEGLWGRMEMAR